jgi:hypothetical protein
MAYTPITFSPLPADSAGGDSFPITKIAFGADSEATRVTATTPMPARAIGLNAAVNGELAFAFANSDAANTVSVSADQALPAELAADGIGEIIVENASTEVDLAVRVYVKQTINGVARYAELAKFNVPKSLDAFNPDQTNKVSAVAMLVQGMFTGAGYAIVVSNNTAVGAAGAFTARALVRAL